MSDVDIYSSRDEAGKALLANIRDYGNLEPPGLWGRPYNAGTKSGYCFSCANYLRMAAATRYNPHKDMRWYSEDKVKSSHFTLREGAEPVILEYWHATENGQGYEGMVRRFYNAEDIEEFCGKPEHRAGDRDSDREYAFGFLSDDGVDMTEVPPTNEALFDAMYGYAQEKGLNNFGAKMAAHLFIKNSHLDYDYQNHPLFTDEELRRLESNPKILFFSMKQANTLMMEMEQREWKRLHSRAESVKEASRAPFEDLSVTYYYSGIPLQDFEGKPYREGEALDGEKAYAFLVQLNAADKEAFDRIQHGEDIQGHTEIYFRYGRYDHGVVSLQLGSLELRNKKTVQEAVFGKLKAFRKELLADDETRRAYLQTQYEFQGMPEIRFIELCRKRNEDCARAESRWGWEEKEYLKNHPEIVAINQRRASVYRYVCNADEIQGDLVEFPKSFVLSMEGVEEGMELYTDHLDYREAMMPELRELVPTGDRNYLVESAESPEELLHRGYGDYLQIALAPEENKAMANLREFDLRIENRGNVEHPFDKPVVEEYFGRVAVEHFLREKKLDAELSCERSEPGCFRRGDRKEMALSYRGEAFARIQYEQGSDSLVEQCPRGLPDCPKELAEAVFQQLRYQGERECSIRDLMQTPKVSHPDFELMEKLEQEEGKEERPGSRATNEDLYAYYAAMALRDFANDTPEKFQKAVVEAMKADGLGKQKMANIAKVNPRFNLGVVTGKEASERTAAKKHTKRSVTATATKELGQERQRERERA